MKKRILLVLVVFITIVFLDAAILVCSKPPSATIRLRESTYFLYYASPGPDMYYAVRGDTGEFVAESEDAVDLIETVLNLVPPNSRIVFGGSGGWYLSRTLTIKGKLNGNPEAEDRGFQEVIIDASQIEFVPMEKDAPIDRDFIVIDSLLGSKISIGLVAANVAKGYSAIKIAPTLPVQYSGNVGTIMSKVEVRMISSLNANSTGIGLELDGTKAPNGITFMDIEVGSIEAYAINVLFADPAPNFAYGNKIEVIRNYPAAGGIGIQDGGPDVTSLYGNNYISNLICISACAGVSIYGSDSRFDLGIVEARKGNCVILQPGAAKNLIIGTSGMSKWGWTDNSGYDNNKVIAP